MLDQNPELSICPEATRSFPGQPGLVVRNMDGSPLLPQFCFSKAIENENALELIYEDQQNILNYSATFTINEKTHVITSFANITASRANLFAVVGGTSCASATKWRRYY